jgi:hypothetical protein
MEKDGLRWKSIIASNKPSELCSKNLITPKNKNMETLLIVNSILVGVCVYFLKDFHKDFKEMSKQVTRLDEKVKNISVKINSQYKGN